jgi:hypothetical protein
MTWEYKVTCLAPKELEDQLNDYGRDGWELVKIDEEVSESWSNGELDHAYLRGYCAIFKRPIRCEANVR